MSVLTRAELERRFAANQLVTDARRKDATTFDLECASYDLMAGALVWKDPSHLRKKGRIKTAFYDPELPPHRQPTVTLQPGQMMFVITKEELNLPLDICATVLSRNNLARKGILALNAGHVDPGFRGPIVIRLISLRTTPWPLVLGEPIFTVVFQTMDVRPEDRSKLKGHPPIGWDETYNKVVESAGNSMSNALFDIHHLELREALARDFVSKSFLYRLISVVVGLIGLVIGLIGLVGFWPQIKPWLKSLLP